MDNIMHTQFDYLAEGVYIFLWCGRSLHASVDGVADTQIHIPKVVSHVACELCLMCKSQYTSTYVGWGTFRIRTLLGSQTSHIHLPLVGVAFCIRCLKCAENHIPLPMAGSHHAYDFC